MKRDDVVRVRAIRDADLALGNGATPMAGFAVFERESLVEMGLLAGGTTFVSCQRRKGGRGCQPEAHGYQGRQPSV
jgi:hypothetical protein